MPPLIAHFSFLCRVAPFLALIHPCDNCILRFLHSTLTPALCVLTHDLQCRFDVLSVVCRYAPDLSERGAVQILLACAAIPREDLVSRQRVGDIQYSVCERERNRETCFSTLCILSHCNVASRITSPFLTLCFPTLLIATRHSSATVRRCSFWTKLAIYGIIALAR